MNRLMKENRDARKIIAQLLENHRTEVSMIAHEIRNPLTLVSSSLQIMEAQHPEVKAFHNWAQTIEDVRFMCDLGKYLRQGGIVFMAFPAWQMPFGGHQQICRSRFLSRLPFFHLLPKPLYRAVLKAGGEEEYRIRELLEIKDTRLSVEQFERLLQQKGKRTDASMDAIRPLEILDRRLWLINPHYEAKFGLKPRLLARPVAAVPYLRDFFTTSCFYILKCLSAEES